MKIFLFEDKKCSTKKRVVKGKSLNRDKLGSKMLQELNPMAFGILCLKSQENPDNDFINSSFRAISESPHKLTEKWVKSINKFVDSYISAVSLDPPDIAVGERVDITQAVVIKICDPKDNCQYQTPALLLSDGRGWKFYFKTSKAYSFKTGQILSFRATVSSHKEGITFFGRASSIVSNKT